MLPYLFENEHLPMYGIMMIIGIALAVVVVLFVRVHSEIGKWDRIYGASIALVGGILGAKLFSVLTNIDTIIEYNLSFVDVIKNGFVFYGGLIGGGAGIIIYCLAAKIPILKFLDIAAIALPLGHAFGRIGCFCSGCCYGRPTDSIFGVIYSNPIDPNTPVGIPLLPTQLFEAGYCLLIFAALFIFSLRKTSRTTGLYCLIYIMSYSVCRFINEFFRYDIARGFVGLLSTSQVISLLLIIIVAITAILKRIKGRVT